MGGDASSPASGSAGVARGERRMETLRALVDGEVLEVPPFPLESFQSKVLEALHLEFFLARCRVLVTPHLSYLTTGEYGAEEVAEVEEILAEKQENLHQLKLFLLRDLALYSALLETNSYYIEVNHHLTIARFLRYPDPAGYEVKLYTLRPEDLPANYRDKIYLGRDLISLDGPRRPHLGLGYLRRALPQQLEKLRTRLTRHVSSSEMLQLEREYLQDVAELLGDFAQGADTLMGTFPSEISSKTLGTERLLEVNREFRGLKHLLAEAEALLREMEQRTITSGSHAARYVTKVRKDFTNTINYILLKVNGRISDAVNGIGI
jgi:hypothetical protein